MKTRLREFYLSTLLAGSLFISPVAAEDLESMVNRANQLADQENYTQAIPLYETAVRQAPKEAVLKNNLMILYANYGVKLQEEKDYEAAHQQFDKALALLPGDVQKTRPVLEAKSATHFQQAMDLKETADTDPQAYEKARQLLQQAMALTPDEAALKKHMASLYLEEGYQLAVQEKFALAAKAMESGLTYDPDSRTLKQSLANVYLGLARDEADNRQAWADKALAMDDSPRMKESVERLLKGGEVAGNATGAGTAVKPSLPLEAQGMSVLQMIAAIEQQMDLKPDDKANLLERLENIEKHIHGETKKGALAVRTKDAYASLMGSYAGSADQSNIGLMQAPVEASTESYLDEIFKVTDGKVIRWGRFPLRVYVQEPDEDSKLRPLYRPEFKEAALHGLNSWKVKTNGFTNYVEVKDAANADVVISFEEVYEDRFADPENVPEVYRNYTPPKKNPLSHVLRLAGMFAPSYYSLAPQAINAALDYQQYKKLEVLRDESRIKLGLKPTEGLEPEAAKTLIQNMAAKEFGHALGLKGLSTQAGDLLYPELRSDIVQTPTARDLQTLSQLYRRPPNIILNVR